MTKDSIEVQMRKNRRIMRGLPVNSKIHGDLEKRNEELGQELRKLKEDGK